jgi:hypothetical protein
MYFRDGKWDTGRLPIIPKASPITVGNLEELPLQQITNKEKVKQLLIGPRARRKYVL